MVLVVGSNTTEAHPVSALHVKRAVARGAKLVVADPRQIPLCRDAVLHLPQRPGTNVALGNGLLHLLIREGLLNDAFIRRHTEGFAAAREVVAAYPPERTAELTGIPVPALQEAARLWGRARRAVLVTGLGVDEHAQGTAGMRALLNLVLATGQVGRTGTGVLTLRGQNNVQGACDMGCLPDVLPGYQPVADPAVRQRFAQVWGVEPPEWRGLTSPGMWEAARSGRLKGMIIWGEDPLRTHAGVPRVREALEALEFLAVSELFLTETARLAQVVFPAASFAEKAGSYTNTERRVRLLRRAIPAVGEAKSDLELFAQLAGRLGRGFASDPAEVFREMADLVPSHAGMSHARLGEAGLSWPCPAPEHPGTARLYVGGFGERRGRFAAVDQEEAVLPEGYPLVLVTGRRLEAFNNAAQTGRAALLGSPEDERLAVHPADVRRLGLEPGEDVAVVSPWGRLRAPWRAAPDLLPGTVFLTFHDPAVPVNELVGDEVRDPVTETYSYKWVPVRVERAGEEWGR